MPLAFSSVSHGSVAFGFFNIETQMLLLERLFFLADRFCASAVELTRSGASTLQGHRIESSSRVGNLHGAIAGQDHTGFIGATYALWPFPREPAMFRQHTDGARNDGQVLELIERFATPVSIPIQRDPKDGWVAIGEYRFSSECWLQLLAYVARGGYPRWRDDVQPDYVVRMVRELAHAPTSAARSLLRK